jgi:hypothetical protein
MYAAKFMTLLTVQCDWLDEGNNTIIPADCQGAVWRLTEAANNFTAPTGLLNKSSDREMLAGGPV